MGKSHWTPPLDRLPPEIPILIKKDRAQFNRKYRHIIERKNLTRQETLALHQLIHNTEIVIKPADKGSVVVIMDTDQYIQEAYRQLHNPKYYIKLKQQIYPKTIPVVNRIMTNLKNKEYINDQQKTYLSSDMNPRPRRFLHPAQNSQASRYLAYPLTHATRQTNSI